MGAPELRPFRAVPDSDKEAEVCASRWDAVLGEEVPRGRAVPDREPAVSPAATSAEGASISVLKGTQAAQQGPPCPVAWCP